VTANFQYDPLGRRTSKTINGVTTGYLYDGNDIAAEIGGGAVGANYLRSLSIDEPFIRQTGTGNEHYHTDALGSSLVLSDATGGSVASYGYEPFGKTTVTGTSSNALQYTGREHDVSETYYYRNRFYSTKLGRFSSEDPLRFGGGDLNLFVYGRNDPANSRDPFGYCPSDLDQCMKDFLRSNYGNFVADTLVPNFALGSMISDFGNFVETSLESLIVKGSILASTLGYSAYKGAQYFDIMSQSAGSFSQFFPYQARAQAAGEAARAANIARAVGVGSAEVVSVAGIGATSFASSAQLMAYLNCIAGKK
jgi:RHS repeat-associated protein